MSLPMRSEVSEVYGAFKRGVDIPAGAAALLALAVLFPFLALAIKLGDRGPILYRQTRLGRYGRPFEILKLRTMSATSAADERQTDTNHQRSAGHPGRAFASAASSRRVAAGDQYPSR